MKKIFSVIAIAAMAMIAFSCKPDNPKTPDDIDNIVEDGVYVMLGDKIEATYAMAVGTNEAADQSAREGMYEKYIVLDANQEFTLAYKAGDRILKYGAELAEFTPTDFADIYKDNPATPVLKGTLVEGDNAPKMKAAKKALYHIVLDLNLDSKLDNAQILVAEAQYGVRGGMNDWNFTAFEAGELSNAGTTFTLADQELGNNGEFKFAYNGAWKITLDAAGEVKANTNLGWAKDSTTELAPGGDNIVVSEGAGKYKITLTFKLAGGPVGDSWSYTIEQQEKSSAPTTMYMNGGQWGGETWDWASDGIVELTPVHSAVGFFWCTRWFDHTQGFKFCSQKAWNGDFGIDGQNCSVEADGFYTILVDGNTNSVQILPAEVYGIGDAWGANAWDFDAADPVKFVAEGQKLVATVTNNSSAVRVASKVVSGERWYDWWKTEFVWFDGKIAYRGAGNDQDRVAVEAGQKITIDFNAGTVTVEDGGPAFVPAITIDGNFDDWADIEAATNGNNTFKVTSDEKYVYFYSHRGTTGRYSEIWDGGGYVYFWFDLDGDETTGESLNGKGPAEFVFFVSPYGGTAAAPAIADDFITLGYGADCKPSTASTDNIVGKGVVTEEGAYIEFSIPRSDMPEIPATEITVTSEGNKDMAKASIKVTL